MMMIEFFFLWCFFPLCQLVEMLHNVQCVLEMDSNFINRLSLNEGMDYNGLISILNFVVF